MWIAIVLVVGVFWYLSSRSKQRALEEWARAHAREQAALHSELAEMKYRQQLAEDLADEREAAPLAGESDDHEGY